MTYINWENITDDFESFAHLLPCGNEPIKLKPDPKVFLPDDCWRKKKEYTPPVIVVKKKTKHKRNKEMDSYRVYGKPAVDETKEMRAERLANAYKKIDERKGLDNNITADYILKHIFNTTCMKCGESDWHKLGCDRIDNTKGHLVDNVVCACRECNIKRNTILFEKFYH